MMAVVFSSLSRFSGALMSRYYRFVVVLTLCLSVSFLGGCGGGGDGIERSVVSGLVTFEGTPVEEGIITFVPTDGVVGAPVQLTIQGGKYSSAEDAQDDRGIVTGLNGVQILATKKTGKQIKNVIGEMEEEVLQYIPAKYNEQSELKQDIKPGKNTIDFELTP